MSVNDNINFDEIFEVDDPRRILMRVVGLGEIGRKGAPYFDRLWALTNRTFSSLDRSDELAILLVAYGSRSLGAIVGAIGFDELNDQHITILDWLIALTDDVDPHLSELAVWGLGDIGVPPEAVRLELKRLANGKLRQCEPEHATIRSVAFRMLARVSRHDAEELVDSHACEEYLASVENWLRELVEKGRVGNESYRLHIEESAWLRDPKNNGLHASSVG